MKRKHKQQKAYHQAIKKGLRAIAPPSRIHVSPKDYVRHREAERLRREIDDQQ